MKLLILTSTILFSILVSSTNLYAEEAQASESQKFKQGLYAPGYTPIDLSNIDDSEDPYMPADSIGRAIYKVEKWFGMDKATTIAKYQSNCDRGYANFCLKLGDMARKDKNLFSAENYYQLSCRYGNNGACKKRDKVYDQRLSYEKDLMRKKSKLETRCSEDEPSSCASLSYIEQYFGNHSAARNHDIKACGLGYPASCLSLSKVYTDEGNFIEAEELKRKAQELFGLKSTVLEKLNGPDLPSH